MKLERKTYPFVYEVDFLLSFDGDEMRSLAPIGAHRCVSLYESCGTKDEIGKELQRFFAEINEIPKKTVKIEVLNFQQI